MAVGRCENGGFTADRGSFAGGAGPPRQVRAEDDLTADLQQVSG